jgi:hypothetical protein
LKHMLREDGLPHDIMMWPNIHTKRTNSLRARYTFTS